MKRTNNNNWIFTISIILTAIVLAFLSFIPINIEYIKPFVVYFDPTKLLSNLPLWIFINSIIALYSHSEKTSMLNTTLFNIICFVSYCLFSKILTHAMPKEMFLTWIVFTLIWAIFAYLVWSANRKDTKGWILSTILLAILFSTCFTYTETVARCGFFREGDRRLSDRPDQPEPTCAGTRSVAFRALSRRGEYYFRRCRGESGEVGPFRPTDAGVGALRRVGFGRSGRPDAASDAGSERIAWVVEGFIGQCAGRFVGRDRDHRRRGPALRRISLRRAVRVRRFAGSAHPVAEHLSRRETVP